MLKLRAAFVVVLLVLVPSAAFAQASITGIVRDSSGAVLPGVTVEASSPALIRRSALPSPMAPARTASSTFAPAPIR